MRWTPAALAHAAGGKLLKVGSRPIETAFIDSRQPRKDALFVPIVAARDGHEFIDSAIEGGASAVLQAKGRPVPEADVTVVEVDDTLEGLGELARSARRERAKVPSVAITGSNGKTTTRAMVEAVLACAYTPVLSTKGNFNNHLGLPLSLLEQPHRPKAEVLELGMSAPGENDHLASIVQPRMGIVTSIALEHLEFMGSLEAIAAAEAEIMPHLPPHGLLVIPSDAPLLEAHVPTGPGAPRVLRVGPDERADLRVVEAELSSEGTRGVIELPGGERVALELRVFGVHNLRNAGAALAVGVYLGIPLPAMVDALAKVDPVGDRGRVSTWRGHSIIADCYNANPGSMQVALESLAAYGGNAPIHRIAVIGDMLELGPTAAQLHREQGELAARLGVDRLIGVGPLSVQAVEAFRAARGTEAGVAFDALPADATAIATSLRDALEGHEGAALLFKGSRGIRLESVVDALTRD